jgi:hypothetical protein
MCNCYDNYELGYLAALQSACSITVRWRTAGLRESKKIAFRCEHGDRWSGLIHPNHPLWAWANQFPTVHESAECSCSVFAFEKVDVAEAA